VLPSRTETSISLISATNRVLRLNHVTNLATIQIKRRVAMGRKVFYCKNCQRILFGKGGMRTPCSECGQIPVESDIFEEEWNVMDQAVRDDYKTQWFFNGTSLTRPDVDAILEHLEETSKRVSIIMYIMIGFAVLSAFGVIALISFSKNMSAIMEALKHLPL